MALFKIYSGTADEFPSNYALHPGYAYFFEDSGELVIDTDNGRIDVKVSQLIKTVNGEVTFVDVDDVLTAADDNGLTKNAILVGGENNTVRAIAIAAGSVVIGDATNGVKGINGTGALYATTSGAPSFGTLPISAGGTGAATVENARTNLDVYSKGEINEKVARATTSVYYLLLNKETWLYNPVDDVYTYNYSLPDLKCGWNGNVPPIISWVTNRDDYSKIDDAWATAGSGITFTTSKAMDGSNMELVVIDVK